MSSKRVKVGMINHDIYPVDIIYFGLQFARKECFVSGSGEVKAHYHCCHYRRGCKITLLLLRIATALSEQIIKGTHSCQGTKAFAMTAPAIDVFYEMW